MIIQLAGPNPRGVDVAGVITLGQKENLANTFSMIMAIEMQFAVFYF